MKPRREPHPMYQLGIACCVAARNIRDAHFRRIAVANGTRIPKSRAEIGGGKRGEMARLGRKTLLALATMDEAGFAVSTKRK